MKNEDTDNTLLIGEVGSNTDKSVIFDNFNDYLDFRRVEFLTIDDASNNNEIFEISFGDNSGTDGTTAKDLAWDNEIVVADNQGDTIYADAGTDVLVGGDGNDTFNLVDVVSTDDHDTMSHVYIKNIEGDDKITMAAGDYSGNIVKDDGVITVQSGANSYMIFTDDEATLETYLANATII